MSIKPDLIPGLRRRGRETAGDGMVHAELGNRNTYDVSIVASRRYVGLFKAYQDGRAKSLITADIVTSKHIGMTGSRGRTHFVFDTPAPLVQQRQPLTAAEFAAKFEAIRSAFQTHAAALAIAKSNEVTAAAASIETAVATESNFLTEEPEESLDAYIERISGFRDADVDAAFDSIMTYNEMERHDDQRISHGSTL